MPRPPAAVSLARVIARRGEHQYGLPRGAWRIDMVSLSAAPADLGRLALLILGDLLHPSPDGVEIRPDHLPHFALGARDGSPINDRDWKDRDVLFGCGGHVGSARLAALLLDLGRPGQPCDEVQLESAPGNGALAPASVELRLWLPGSVGFEPADD